jgi:hypothetical protein
VLFAHDVRVQECIVSFLNDDRVPFVGCGLYGLCGPQTLQIYDFSLQILFQEMEIGHL